MHVRTRVGEAGAEDASLSEDHVSERVTDIIKQCLNAHGGGGWSSLGPMPRRLPLRRQALPVPRQQQQQQQHKQAVVQNQGRTPDLGNCPHLQ